ncbi:MAG TPA: sigma-70 family RNA polymerase sigma factor [Candidatus Nanopelagicales bacterium]|nr:sigma-70 family RNA polymerase sigma factor [Candidatus Krumholzibacteria bacterium]HRV67670.1 sigma-70 family RNA polymerase sigma factor [Candidatus Nanopelagicales bacterium]
MENTKQRILDGYARDVIRHKARQLIGKYGFTRDDYDDLQQEMMLDLLRRLGKYDPSKAGLNTFVARIVDRKVSTLIRHQRQEKRDYRRQVCSLDAQVEDQDGQARGLDEVLSQDAYDDEVARHDRPEAERLDLRLDLSLVLDELPEDLRQLPLRLQSRTVAEIARELGVPRSTLYEKGIARLRKIFEDKGLREYLGEARHPGKGPGK